MNQNINTDSKNKQQQGTTTEAPPWNSQYKNTWGLKPVLIYVFSYFPFGFEGRIWDLIVSVPDHCLSFYFAYQSSCGCAVWWP